MKFPPKYFSQKLPKLFLSFSDEIPFSSWATLRIPLHHMLLLILAAAFVELLILHILILQCYFAYSEPIWRAGQQINQLSLHLCALCEAQNASHVQ